MSKKTEYELSKHSDDEVKIVRRDIDEKEQNFTIQQLRDMIVVLKDLKVKIQAECDKKLAELDGKIADAEKNIQDSLNLGVKEKIKDDLEVVNP